MDCEGKKKAIMVHQAAPKHRDANKAGEDNDNTWSVLTCSPPRVGVGAGAGVGILSQTCAMMVHFFSFDGGLKVCEINSATVKPKITGTL